MTQRAAISCLILLILFIGAWQQLGNSREIKDSGLGTVIATVDVRGAENMTLTLFYPWSSKPDSTSALKLDPGKKYVVVVVDVSDS